MQISKFTATMSNKQLLSRDTALEVAENVMSGKLDANQSCDTVAKVC